MGGTTRNEIIRIVNRHGVIHKSELCREIGSGWGNIGHHLHFLERREIVETFRDESKLWVQVPKLTEFEQNLLRATAPADRWDIIMSLALGETDTIKELSRSLDKSQKVIRTHLGHLVKSGAIEKIYTNPQHFRVSSGVKRWLSSRSRRWRRDVE
jgi:predicted transcriptional regulator